MTLPVSYRMHIHADKGVVGFLTAVCSSYYAVWRGGPNTQPSLGRMGIVENDTSSALTP
jgi:hypothetical protein